MTAPLPPVSPRYLPLHSTEDARPFQHMTYRTYAPLLAQLQPGQIGVAVGAVASLEDQPEQPVGLALALLQPEENNAQVVSLFVNPAARHRGIGLGLMTHIEEALHARGVPHIFGVYPSGKETTPHLEAILARNLWSIPNPRMYLFQASRGSFEAVLRAPWMRSTELPPEYDYFPWREHTPADRALILAGVESGLFPATLSPYSEESIVDLDVSLGLRYRGEVYGWMICHRIAPQTVRYTALYVRENIPHKGLGFKMFAESLQRHLRRDADAPEITGCWGVLASNPFAGFLQRRLIPHLPDSSYSLTYETYKILSGAPTTQPGP